KETLTSRLIDRPIRPLFPDGFKNEVQVICLVISGDQENDPDVLAINGASAALCLSGIPFDGPVGAVRVGQIDGSFVVNPTTEQRNVSTLELVIAGTEDAVLMVEAGAKEVPEETMLEAIAFGADESKKAQARVAFEAAESAELRRMIVEQNLRLDGRKPNEIRPITIEAAYLPRAHGSSLFTRGETQALVSATLGTKSDEQKVE